MPALVKSKMTYKSLNFDSWDTFVEITAILTQKPAIIPIRYPNAPASHCKTAATAKAAVSVRKTKRPNPTDSTP